MSKSIALVFFVLCGVGCGQPKLRESLIEFDQWARVEEQDDPFATRRLPGELCDPGALSSEDFGGEPALDIAVERCGFVTLTQPALVEVEAGDILHMRLWHFDLTARDRAESTIVVMIGGVEANRWTIPIPAEGQLLAPAWTAGFASEAGSAVVRHLDNHGTNTYALIELSRGGSQP